MIDQIENFMNELTDMDWGWWPVLFLRPSKDKDIDNAILLKLSLVFGSIVGVFLFLMNFLMAGATALVFGSMVDPSLSSMNFLITAVITLGIFLFSILLGWLFFFIGYKVTFVYFWNRRAKRLRHEKLIKVYPSKP